MRTTILAIAALVSFVFPATAQTPKPAVGSEQVYWVVTFNVEDMAKFKPIVQKLVAATEKEPGALAYEYSVGTDGKTVDIYERYVDSKAAVSHLVDNFVPNFSKEFLSVAKGQRFVVYGPASDELKKVLADLQPTYMTLFDGFTR
jgi:quinol monooxygenase YgiN